MRIFGRFSKSVLFAIVTYTAINYVVWPLVQQKPNQSSKRDRDTSLGQETDRVKDFVYLVQTPECLPSNLISPNFFGNENICNCDVIALSFKEQCESSLLPHIQYVHRKNASWTKGRNLLLEHAKDKGNNYQYYIFIDDDIRLTFNELAPLKMNVSSPLRVFEKFLKEYEPVVGVTDYEKHHGAKTMIAKRKQLCKDSGLDKPIYIPTVHFDASFNAFHYKSLDYLLPYTTKYDDKCWWHAQRNLIAKVEVIFRGQAVMLTPVRSLNLMHSKYPRDDTNAQQIWSSFIEDITHEIPSQYRGATLLREFRKDPLHYTENSLSVCLHLPAHNPIVPFQHFSWHFE